jgi:hypothetical protein
MKKSPFNWMSSCFEGLEVLEEIFWNYARECFLSFFLQVQGIHRCPNLVDVGVGVD